MRTNRTHPALLLAGFLAALLSTGCGPFLVFPGGRLRGTLDPGEIVDWRQTHDVEFVQIETRPNDPYSVQVYGVGSERGFYIASQGWRGMMGSTDRARWVEHLAEDPRLRLRIGRMIYPLSATRIEAASEIEFVRALFREKYGEAAEDWGFWRDDPGLHEFFVYRLEPR